MDTSNQGLAGDEAGKVRSAIRLSCRAIDIPAISVSEHTQPSTLIVSLEDPKLCNNELSTDVMDVNGEIVALSCCLGNVEQSFSKSDYFNGRFKSDS